MFFIYAIVDPRSPGHCRYVGKTEEPPPDRLKRHVLMAKRGEQSRKNNWLRSLLREGVEPRIFVLDEQTDGRWQNYEQEWIARLLEEGHSLTNCSAGGDGVGSDGWREIWSRPGMRERQSAALKEHNRNPAVREKKRADNVRRFSSDAAKKQHGELMREVLARPEVKKIKSVACERSWNDPSIRARRMAGQQQWHATEEASAMASKRAKDRWAKSGSRESASKERKAMWSNPAMREKIVAAMHAAKHSITAEERSAATKRGWITRRAKQNKD